MNERRLSSGWWVENLLRPMLIAAMVACLAAPVVVFLEWLAGDWNGTYFLVFAFFASLEGILSERALQKQGISGWSYLFSRAGELLILLILLKVANYIPVGLGRLWADAQLWPANPDLIVTNFDLFTIALFVPLWIGSLSVGRLVSELDAHQGQVEAPEDKTSTAYYLWLTQPSVVRDRQERLDWLGETFLWGGVMLLLSAAGIHFLLPTMPVPAIPTLLYFALGVALLSQARFSVAHIGWRVQGIPVQPNIGRRWLLWTAIFLVGLALLASILPTGYAMGPIRALLGILGLVVQVITYFFALLYFLFSLLLSLFLPSVEPTPPPPLPAQPISPPEPRPSASPLPWVETLLSALFWLVVLGIVAYALFRFLKERLSLFEADGETQSTWWGRLLGWLRDLWHQWRTWQRGVQETLARRLAERRAGQAGRARPFRFFNLRRLSPRELVRYFYLSAERRAARAGQPRRPDQTPYEYRTALDGRFPDLEPDLEGLTDAFVQARYSPQPVQAEDAEAIKPLWERIKAALRRRRASSRQ